MISDKYFMETKNNKKITTHSIMIPIWTIKTIKVMRIIPNSQITKISTQELIGHSKNTIWVFFQTEFLINREVLFFKICSQATN